MAGQRTSFGKLQRDGAKKAKAAAKRERRQDRDPAPGEDQGDGPAGPPTGPVRSSAELLADIEALHQSFDAGTISYEDFEEKKADLLGRLPID